MANKKPFKFSTARGITALLVVLAVVAGLIFRIGSGTPSAFGIEQIAAICPLGALEVMLGAKEFLLHPIILFVLVVVVILLVGKAFCSWMCPVPWIQNFFRPSKKKNGKKNKDAEAAEAEVVEAAQAEDASEAAAVPAELSAEETAVLADATKHSCTTCGACEALKKVGGKRDGLQVDSRHIVLLGALGSAAIFGFPVFCLICPVGLTFATIIGLWNMFQFNEPSWALLIAPALIILEVVFLRKWCMNFCPISALVGLISGANKTFKPQVDEELCVRNKGVDCHVCVDTCPELVDPHSSLIPECSKCGACVEACPAHAISIKALPRGKA